jgi:hypothetical protein
MAFLAGCGSLAGPGSTDRSASQRDTFDVVVAGDSVARELEPALAAAFDGATAGGGERSQVTFALLPALATSTLVSDTRHLIDEHHPDVVVVLIGTWEGVGVDTTVAGWEERYLSDVIDPFLRTLAVAEVDVVWLGYPPLASRPDAQRHDQLDLVYRSLPPDHPNVTYVDAGRAVSDADGGYVESLALPGLGDVQVRQTDGRHLCPMGVELMATPVVTHLHERFGLVPVARWPQAAWRDDPDGYEHPEQCPSFG